MEQLDSQMRIHILYKRFLRDEHNGSKARNDANPRPTLRNGVHRIYLAAAAVHSLIQPLPSGTAFCIGVVLMVMMTGRLVQTKGSLARAVLPFVVHLRWGWHRVERATERGKLSLDAMFDQ